MCHFIELTELTLILDMSTRAQKVLAANFFLIKSQTTDLCIVFDRAVSFSLLANFVYSEQKTNKKQKNDGNSVMKWSVCTYLRILE